MPDLFDLQRAQEARDDALERVEHNPTWQEMAVSAIEAVSLGAIDLWQDGTLVTSFTSDDVLRYDERLEECPEKRVLGSAFHQLSRAGIIEPTGRYVASKRIKSHGRRKCEWRRCWNAKI